MRSFIPLVLLAGTAFSSPFSLFPHKSDSKPSVTIRDGTIEGSVANGVESFNGIPFADPPIKDLRLKPPQPLSKSFGNIKSQKNAKSCPQFVVQSHTGKLPQSVASTLVNLPITQAVADYGEDCLTINVIRPENTTADAKLPVLFWIFGGGFELGSTAQYDGQQFVNQSIRLNEPVIWVAVNYRVSGFGFLAGKELAAEGSTNLGLRDQRLGLQWTADNIAKFGGDPDKVTIWGESAGAISVYDHLIINGGDNTYKGKPLYRAAIANSGSAVPTDDVTAPQAQKIYDQVVVEAGCDKEKDTLACLRKTSYTRLLSAINSVPSLVGYRALDLSYLPRPDPGDNFFPESPEVPGLALKWPKVPIIIGDQEDEGTLFGLFVGNNITTNAELIQYLASYFPTNPNATQLVTGLADLYPNNPDGGQPAGAPFNTGDKNNLYPQFKRLSAILGDIVFTLPRRIVLDVANPRTDTWSYISSVLRGTPVLGSCHGSDLLFDFGLVGKGDDFRTTSIQTYYINFINNMDPNKGAKNESLVAWPKYNSKTRPLLELGKNYTDLYPGGDHFRQAAADYLRVSMRGIRYVNSAWLTCMQDNIPQFRV